MSLEYTIIEQIISTMYLFVCFSVQRRQELADQRAIELKTMAIKAFKTSTLEGI